MEIRVLRYFLETAREGNITRAAERLHVTQPTMSRQLKDLEEELGKKLFVRTNYALRLACFCASGRKTFWIWWTKRKRNLRCWTIPWAARFLSAAPNPIP